MTSKWGAARAAVAVTGLSKKNADFLGKTTETVLKVEPVKEAWRADELLEGPVISDGGKPLAFDPEFTGVEPFEKRQCHNCAAAVIFVLMVVGMFGIFGYAFLKGSYHVILYGEDSSGHRCGADGQRDYTSLKFLLWVDPTSAIQVKQCVDKCPSAGQSAVGWGGTAYPVSWDTKAVLNRCLPQSCSPNWSATQCSTAKTLVTEDYPGFLSRFFADCATMDGMVGMTMGLGCGILLDLLLSLRINHYGQTQAKVLYCITVLMVLVFAGLILANTGNIGSGGVSAPSIEQDDTFSYLTIFFGVLMLVLWVVMLAMGFYLNKNLDLVEFVMREIAVPIAAIPGAAWMPLFPALTMMFASACWVFSTVLLLGLPNSLMAYGLSLYQLLGVFMCFEMASGTTKLMVAGTVATWYWSSPTELKVVQEGAVCRSISRSFRNSLGGLARASFVFAFGRSLFGLLRLIHRGGHPIRNDPGCPGVTQGCCCLCLPLAECTKMHDDRVYVQMAVHGAGWSDALTRSYQLFYRSRDTAEFATAVMDKMLFVSRMANATLAGAVTFGWLANDSDIYCATGPTIIVCCVATGISSNFAAMYQSTIDTVMESYCEDKERNDGSYMRRYHMTAGLKQLFTQDLSQAAEAGSPTTPGPDDVVQIENSEESPRGAQQRSRMEQAEIEEIEELSLYYNAAKQK